MLLFANSGSSVDALKNNGIRAADTTGDGCHLVVIFGDPNEEHRRKLPRQTVPGGYVIICREGSGYMDDNAKGLRDDFYNATLGRFSVETAVNFFDNSLQRRWFSAWLSTEPPNENDIVVVGQNQSVCGLSLEAIQNCELNGI